MKQEEYIKEIAIALDDALNDLYGMKMGFMLLVTPFADGTTVCDYISNSSRDDCIKWLRETAYRLENKEDIPKTQGNA